MIAKIAFRNIWHKPLSAILSLALLMFSVGIITLLILMQNHLEQKFGNDLKDIDVVVGAKGSPLQLVLSAIYHIDSPTGNMSAGDAKKLLRNPMITQAIPLSYGDSYEGFRMLGTSIDYLQKYEAEFAYGSMFDHPMEAVLGANVAAKSGLTLGSQFYGSHGEVAGADHVHDNVAYTVVGLLKRNGSVLDNLVLTDVESVWTVHADHGDEGHEGHDHAAHDHNHDHGATSSAKPGKEVILGIEDDEKEITAMLLTVPHKISMLNLPRIINENTTMQAALPGIIINDFREDIGIGVTTLQLIGLAIMLMSGFSVFFVLYNRMRERKYELALLRASGYRPYKLFLLLLTEGLILAAVGYLLGLGLSRIGIWLVNQEAAGDFQDCSCDIACD